MDIAEIERQVFRKVISNPQKILRSLNKVAPSDFQNKLFRVVIEALSTDGTVTNYAPNKSFFEILLRGRIRDQGELERISLVLEGASKTPVDDNDLDLLIKELKSHRMCREMTRIIQEHVEHIRPEDIEKTYDEMVRDMLKLPLSAASGISVATVREVHEALEERLGLYDNTATTRYATNIKAFDASIGGFANGEFVVITAGTGQGKSNVMLWWAEQYVKKGAKVLYIIIEMGYVETMVRYHAMATAFDVTDIGNKRIPQGQLPEYYKRLILHAKDTSCHTALRKDMDNLVEQTDVPSLMAVAKKYKDREGKLFFVDIDSANPTRVEREIQMRAMDERIDYVFVDFINVMDPEFHNRDKVKELSSIARDLKKVARKTNTVLFSAAQLDTTSIQGKQDEVISPDRVKYARAIAENADWMIAFHRTDEDKRLKQIRLQLAKHRHSNDCTALLEFDMGTMQVVDLGKAETEGYMGSADNSQYRSGGAGVKFIPTDEVEVEA